jgi:hypothetical protein
MTKAVPFWPVIVPGHPSGDLLVIPEERILCKIVISLDPLFLRRGLILKGIAFYGRSSFGSHLGLGRITDLKISVRTYKPRVVSMSFFIC